jgi:hypothetical protein
MRFRVLKAMAVLTLAMALGGCYYGYPGYGYPGYGYYGGGYYGGPYYGTGVVAFGGGGGWHDGWHGGGGGWHDHDGH